MTDTRNKLNEAKYFLERMKETNRDKNGFRYNLSAFLTAFSSVIQFMNIEFQRVPGFISWYQSIKAQLSRDKIALFFDKQRNRTTHLRPVSTRTHQNQMNFPELDLTKLITFSITAKINDDGIMDNPQLTRLTNEGILISEEVTATTLWKFSDLPLDDNPTEKDVVSLCEEQLAKLEIIVQECEQLYSKQ